MTQIARQPGLVYERTDEGDVAPPVSKYARARALAAQAPAAPSKYAAARKLAAQSMPSSPGVAATIAQPGGMPSTTASQLTRPGSLENLGSTIGDFAQAGADFVQSAPYGAVKDAYDQAAGFGARLANNPTIGRAMEAIGLRPDLANDTSGYEPDVQPPDSVAGQLGRGFGSVGSMFAASALTGGAPVILPLVAGAQSLGATYQAARQRALEMGADEAQAHQIAAAEADTMGLVSTVTSLPVGKALSGIAPQALSRAVATANRGGQLGQLVKTAVAEGSQEAAEEAAQMILQRVAEDDPAAFQDWQKRIAISAGAGAIGGGVIAGVQAVGSQRGQRQAPQDYPAQRDALAALSPQNAQQFAQPIPRGEQAGPEASVEAVEQGAPLAGQWPDGSLRESGAQSSRQTQATSTTRTSPDAGSGLERSTSSNTMGDLQRPESGPPIPEERTPQSANPQTQSGVPSNLSSLTVAQLRALDLERGGTGKGTKKALMARLESGQATRSQRASQLAPENAEASPPVPAVVSPPTQDAPRSTQVRAPIPPEATLVNVENSQPSYYSSMPLPELRAEAVRLGVDSRGTKVQLLRRLSSLPQPTQNAPSGGSGAESSGTQSSRPTDSTLPESGSSVQPSSPPAPMVREPWQMTREEWIGDGKIATEAGVELITSPGFATEAEARAWAKSRGRGFTIGSRKTGNGTKVWTAQKVAGALRSGGDVRSQRALSVLDDHRAEVERAIAEGKIDSHPDYPDLKAKYAQTPQAKAAPEAPSQAPAPKVAPDVGRAPSPPVQPVEGVAGVAPKNVAELQAKYPGLKITPRGGVYIPSTLKGKALAEWRNTASGKPFKDQIPLLDARLAKAAKPEVAETAKPTAPPKSRADKIVETANDDTTSDALSDILNPGDENTSMGAAPDPRMEIGPDGKLRPRVRSASDLVVDSASDAADFKFKDEGTEGRFKTAARGLGKLPTMTKIRGVLADIRKGLTGGSLPELPRTTQFGEARNQTRKILNARQVAADRTEQVLARTIVPLSPKDYDLFSRKVILDDLTSRTSEGESLPFGFTPETAKAELARLDKHLENNPRVRAAVEYRNRVQPAIVKDYVSAMQSMGVDLSERFKRENYYRHQVLYYAELRQQERAGTKSVPVPNRPQLNTGRGFLRQRGGSELDINANYVQAEWEVLSQMIADTQVAKALNEIRKKYDIYPKVAAELKAYDGPATLEEFVPDTHQIYVVRPGRTMFSVTTVPEQLAADAIEASASTLNVPVEKLRHQLAVGSDFKPMILPKEVATQLEKLPEYAKKGGPFDAVVRQSLRAWKAYQLQAPHRVLKYNLRNASEVEKVATINRSALKEIPRATKELWSFFKQSEDAPTDVREWAERGGASLVRVNELEDVPDLERLVRRIDADTKREKIARVPGRAWRGYWDTVGKMSDFRESVLRYAMYLDYKAQLEAGNGKPRNYGASNRAEVDGIKDIRDKAFRLSSDVMGDYGDVSRFGQWMRSHLFPFWSFKETNFRTYVGAMKNMAHDGKTASQIAKAFLPTGARVGISATLQIAKLAGLLYGARFATQILNLLLNGENEKDLPPQVQRSLHITGPKDANGEIRYFDRLGTSQDFLKWFGADAIDADVSDLLSGRRTLAEIAGDMAAKPVKEVVGGLTPAATIPLKQITGRDTFPDPFNPRRINDRTEAAFAEFGLEGAYRTMTGKPSESKGVGKRVMDLATYAIHPDKAAYYRILDERERFKDRIGMAIGGTSEGARTYALRNAKMAVRYGDVDTAARYLRQYYSLGGTERGIAASFASMDPLHGLTDTNKTKFLESLTSDDRRLVEKAQRYYRETLMGSDDALSTAKQKARKKN